MQITGLYIKGNRRLLDKKTMTVDWNVQSDIQLLIGGNGFGKSTLLGEFSPLPAIAKNYLKTGCKIIKLIHNHKHYILTSDFSKKHKHSFIDVETNQELNKGGTITVQTDLCKQVLGYTAEIHNFLQGKVKLTTMSVRERKDFFSRISDVSVDYAMQIYDNMRSELRNLTGVEKYNKTKIFEETKKLLSKEEMDEYRRDLATLKNRTSEILGGMFPDDNTHYELTQLENEIGELSDHVVKTHASFTGLKDIEQLESMIYKVKVDKEDYERQLKSILERVALHKQKLEMVHSVVEYPTEQVKKDLFSLKDELNDLEEKESVLSVIVDHKFYNADTAQLAFQYLQENASTIQTAFKSMPDDSEKKLSDTNLGEKLVTAVSQIDLEIARQENNIQTRLDQIKHIEHGEEVKCPKCEHAFIPGMDKTHIEGLKTQNETVAKSIELLEQRKQRIVDYKEQWDERQRYLRQILHVLESRPLYAVTIDDKSLKDYLIHNDLIYTSPASLSSKVTSIVDSLGLKERLLKKQSQIDELATILAERDRLGIDENSVSASSKAVESLEAEYQTILNDMTKLDSRYKDLTAFKQRLMEESAVQQRLLDKVKLLNDSYIAIFKQSVNEQLKEELASVTMRMQKMQETISRCDIVEGVIKHLNESLEQVEVDVKIYLKMIEVLGPQKGLIGKSLISFTNYFIDKMNEVIKSIWQTPLTILPMTVSEKGFSYNFKVITYDESNASGDVAETSSGEAEIIDFAFMLITASCLGLTNYPLLLDEVGKFFKLEHKVRLYDYLKLLSEHDKASTIVLISHFKGTYEALTRADVCRLDPTGLEIQDHENKFFKVGK